MALGGIALARSDIAKKSYFRTLRCRRRHCYLFEGESRSDDINFLKKKLKINF